MHAKTTLRRTCAVMLALAAMLLTPLAHAAEGVVNTKALILRKSASKSSKALQTLDKGTTLHIKGSTGSWYKVSYGKYTGYVMKKYVKVDGKVEEDAKDTGKAESSASKDDGMKGIDTIRDIGKIPGPCRPDDRGGDVKKIQQALTLTGFYDGKIDGVYGEGTAKAVKAFQRQRKLDCDGVAGRQTIKALFAEDQAASDDKKEETDQAGMKGIASMDDIGKAPASTHKGSRGADVKKLQQALTLKGFYTGKIDGVYGEGTVKAVKAFQKKHGLSRDGVAGKVTIKLLFGEKAADAEKEKKVKTESLKWFGNENVIPKGARFTIKDCVTGRTFQAERWSGANHIDAEPLTREDTAAMKAIYGGSWSWRRRAILVQYNGHVYAASMNGMPHGTTTIDNGFDGHFCIHFTGSKTHGTKKVDKDHQNAVETAMKYSW